MTQFSKCLLWIACCMCLNFPASQAQEKFDEVLLTSGVEYVGQVKEINDQEIKFSHKGESLVYSIPRSQIFRISFASGRTEIMNPVDKGGDTGGAINAGPPKMNKDMIAVLPFRFISSKPYPGWEDMAFKIQEEAYMQAMANIPRYQFQPPATTNAILLRKGINPQQVRAYTMDELCSILGVGFVMFGEVNLRSTGYNSVGSQSVYQNNSNTVTKPGGSVSTNTNTTVINNNRVTESFATQVQLRVYSDRGIAVFNRSKESVWAVPDAYKATLSYLLKRTGL